MSIDFNFKKLTVYQKSLNLANSIYSDTKNWPKDFSFSIPILEIAYKQGIIDFKRKEEWRTEIISLSKMLSKLKSSIS